MWLSPSSSSCAPRRRVGRAEPDRSRAGTGPISMRGVAGVPGGRRSSSMLHMGGWGLCRAGAVFCWNNGIFQRSSRAAVLLPCAPRGSTHMGTGPRPLLTLLFRTIPLLPPTPNAHECATPTIRHTEATRTPAEPPHGHPTHLTRPPTPKTTPPETTTPHTRTRPRCPDTPQPQHKTGPISTRRATDLGTGYDRSRRGERPISNRKRTDLGTGYDRSRAGEQPISTRNRTDLGGVRLAGLTSPGGPRRDDVAPCLKRGRGRRVGASQPALPGRESAARQGRTA